MRLYHVSEESDIQVFHPRLPKRKDLDPAIGLVWAIDEDHLPNFLTPRDCPRVTYRISKHTSTEDQRRFFSSSTHKHAVVIESRWYPRMKNTVLYLYEFDPSGFELQDEIAGYYVSRQSQMPIRKHEVHDLIGSLCQANVEFRMVDQLWDLASAVQSSTLHYSLCRMANAQPK